MIVGLTGGIGSGKSAAADCFAALGISVVDADAVARELTLAGGAAMPAIEAAFGSSVIAADGSLDRTAMRQLAFSDKDARKRLEAILHPLVRQICNDRCQAAPPPYVVLMVPLLVESGSYRERVQRLVVVDCPEAMQIERVMARNGLSQEEVERIMAAQASRAERLAAADDVIDNTGNLEDLARQVTALHDKYIQICRFS